MHRFQNGNPSPEIDVNRPGSILLTCQRTRISGQSTAPHCEARLAW